MAHGSFTGVRIGIATAKAFSDSKHIKLTAVNSLEGLAYNINTNSNIICSLIDAKNDNVYYGIFEKKENLFSPIFPIGFDNINNVIKILKDKESITFIGDGALNYKELLLNNFPNSNFANSQECLASGVSIGKSGYYKYLNNEYGFSTVLSPLYLRKSQAEIALEEKNK